MNSTSPMQKQQFKIPAPLMEAIKLFLIGGVGVTAVFGSYMGIHDVSSFIRMASYQGLIWIVLWMGNGWLNNYLSQKISWLDRPQTRLILGVVFSVIYTMIAITGLFFVWKVLIHRGAMEDALKYLNADFYIPTLLVTALISLFIHCRQFLKEWRESASEAERLKMENLSARYETLKNQVNPHFLFNSFNVLSTLVYKDQDQAAKFIRKLSHLYRYVLETKDQETVRIEEELEALKAFSYLSKMRFGDNFQIKIDLEHIKQQQIAPMTLQMLVENAIKHNIVSQAKPLLVKLYTEGDFIIIKNNLQRKSSVRDSAGIGLPNIQARYEYLSDQRMKVQENNDYFIVSIPVLKL